MTLVVDIDLLYRLVAVVESRPTWNLELFATALGVSRKTVYNILERVKSDGLGVDIQHQGTRQNGRWVVVSLGLLDNDYARVFIDDYKRSYSI